MLWSRIATIASLCVSPSVLALVIFGVILPPSVKSQHGDIFSTNTISSSLRMRLVVNLNQSFHRDVSVNLMLIQPESPERAMARIEAHRTVMFAGDEPLSVG